MHAEAGDTLEIWLRNLLNVHVNLEPMGNAWNVHGMLQPIQVSELFGVSDSTVWGL